MRSSGAQDINVAYVDETLPTRGSFSSCYIPAFDGKVRIHSFIQVVSSLFTPYGVHTSFEKIDLLCYLISLLIMPFTISSKRGKAR